MKKNKRQKKKKKLGRVEREREREREEKKRGRQDRTSKLQSCDVSGEQASEQLYVDDGVSHHTTPGFGVEWGVKKKG